MDFNRTDKYLPAYWVTYEPVYHFDGLELRRCRRATGLSLTAFADRIDSYPKKVRGWLESPGEKSVDGYLMRAIIEALGGVFEPESKAAPQPYYLTHRPDTARSFANKASDRP